MTVFRRIRGVPGVYSISSAAGGRALATTTVSEGRIHVMFHAHVVPVCWRQLAEIAHVCEALESELRGGRAGGLLAREQIEAGAARSADAG